MMPDNLPELRDIHLPEAISAFPPAYGWWVIFLLLIFIFFLFLLIRKLLLRSKKRYALRLLQSCSDNSLSSAEEMSKILRRICLVKYPHASSLFGQEWIDFLNNHCKSKLSSQTADLLLNAPYIKKNSSRYSNVDIVNLRRFCEKWIGENL